MGERLSYKAKSLILLFCILLVTVLSLAIYFEGRGNSCDQCEVHFKTTRVSGILLENPIQYDVKMVDLFNNLTQQDLCVIKVDKNQGYYYGI